MIIEYLSENRAMIPEIAENLFQEWGYLRPESSVFRYILKLNERTNIDKIPFSIVAKSETGKFIGIASLVENDMDVDHEFRPWISGVLVQNENRNKGIGSALVKKLESLAYKLRFNKLYLFTFDKEAFYLKLGWSIIKKDHYLNSEISIMFKELTN